MTARILGVGAAAPALRLEASEVGAAWGRAGGRGTSAVCAPDEDVLTLAWDAGRAALDAAGIPADHVDGLWWGTSRPPFAEGPSHSYLAAGLGLATHAGGMLVTGSAHAGLDALLAGADAVAAGSARLALVVASDALRPGPGTALEPHTGAGAAAILLAPDGGLAGLGVRVTRARPVLDRYRGDGEDDTRDLYDPRLFREAIFFPLVGEVMATIEGFEPRAWSLPDPDGRLGRTLARRAGTAVTTSTRVYAEVGDAGAAAPLLGLIAALDAAGLVAAVAYGGGRASGITVRADAPVPGAALVGDQISHGRPASYAEVLRSRGQLLAHGETVPMGVPPGSALFVRGAEEMLGGIGGRCDDCGVISTPPSVHPTCVACGSEKLTPVTLARHGTVHTFVVNQTMPAPFVAPLPLAVVDLDDGARLMVQVIGDGEDIAIGREVELVLRRYAHERGAPVYGYKARARSLGATTTGSD